MMTSNTVARLLFLSAMVLFPGVETSGKTCEDRLINCADFEQDSCGRYPDWANKNCAKTCGVCVNDCPDGWSLYEADQACLKLFGQEITKRLSWSNSSSFCQSQGGELVKIQDEDKNRFVLELSGSYSLFVWIGIKNVAMVGFDFEFVDGTNISDSYHPWTPGNPDNYLKKERCVDMYPLSGKWNDFTCENQLAFVCSRPARTPWLPHRSPNKSFENRGNQEIRGSSLGHGDHF